MKHFLFFAVFLIAGTVVIAQSSKTKSFSIPKKGTVVLDGKNDVWSPTLKNHSLPKPDGNADEKLKKNIQNQLQKAYQRKDGRKVENRAAVVDTPIMLRNFTGNNFNNFVPNDNDMAISDGGIVSSVTNTTIFSRNTVTGINYGSYNLHTLTSSLGLQQEEFDPKIIYDPQANRFIAIILNGFTDSTSNVLVGFSQTDSTWGAWNFYALPGDPLFDTSWTDFPMGAITEQELFITVNLLYNDSSWQSGFRQTIIWQIKKSEGYSGASLNPHLHYGISHDSIPVRNLCPVKGGSRLYGPDMYFLSNRNFAFSNDTFFLVHINDTINAPGQLLTVNPVLSDVAYHMPVNALQTFVDSLAVNDARVMGAFTENGLIHFVFNCLDTASGKDCVYYGLLDSTAGWNINGYLYTHSVLDLAYPNISYCGYDSTDNRSIIVLLYSSPSNHPGTAAATFDGVNQFSGLSTIKAGQSYTNMLIGTERWGDYTGSQRRYNQNGFVWVSGGYTILNHTTRTWIAELVPDITTDVPKIPEALDNGSLLFPNPSSDRITVEFNNPGSAYLVFEIYDASGRLVKKLFRGSVIKGSNEFSFSAASLPTGNYLLHIAAGNGETVVTKKFVKD
jgi:hypothetical protein